MISSPSICRRPLTLPRTRLRPYLLLLILCCAAQHQLVGQAGRVGAPAKVLVRIDGEKENLSAIAILAVSARGVLSVDLPQDGAIRLFSAAGKAIASIGRKGSGPGEFGAVNTMGWVADTLWVSDAGNHRLTMVGADGRVLRMVPVPTTLHGADGTLQQVIAQEPSDPCHIGGAQAEAILPLCSKPIATAAADGSRRVFVTTTIAGPSTSSYLLTSIGPKGDTVFSRRYSVPVVSIPASTRDSVNRRIDSMPPVVRAIVKPVALPQYFPPVGGVRVSTTGAIWVFLRGNDTQSREIRIVDSLGRPRPSVWMPRGIPLLAFEARGAWGIQTNADGVENIVLFAGGS